jgi:hypothetical protein
MKIYLDDVRETPEGWYRCFWPEEVIAILKSGTVTEVSLDHDLGNDGRGTGYDVLLWLEEHVHTTPSFIPPIIHVHSANISAARKMRAAADKIQRIAQSHRDLESTFGSRTDTTVISRLKVDIQSMDRPGHTHLAGTEIAPVQRAGTRRGQPQWCVEIRTPEGSDFWYEQIVINQEDSEIVEMLAP